jgi:hypothetical protein
MLSQRVHKYRGTITHGAVNEIDCQWTSVAHKIPSNVYSMLRASWQDHDIDERHGNNRAKETGFKAVQGRESGFQEVIL